tara:strand:- start:771 stop:1424 length:654 start_codon:yes stop_codon:yes gene_type:complete
MSDSEDEPITRDKKPLSEARLAAIERMKEGRKRSLEEKKKLKEEEKQKKKEIKKKIKMKVEEEMNGISSLPLDDKEFTDKSVSKAMEDLKQKAVAEVKIEEVVDDLVDEEEFVKVEEPKEVNIVGKPIIRQKPIGRPYKPKKKVVVNNYYEDESSEEEEQIVNNYHKKKKKKNKVVKKIESSSSSEEEIIEYEEEEYTMGMQQSYRPPNAMSGIRFC